ncbi:MAG: hypothetical protein QW210_01140 [Candidatus Woesearchaeota archaeon]
MIDDKIDQLYDEFYAKMGEFFNSEEITDSLVILLSRKKVLENYINKVIDQVNYIRHKNENFYYDVLDDLSKLTISKMWKVLNNKPSEQQSLEEYEKNILEYHKEVIDCANDLIYLKKLIDYYTLYDLFCAPYYLEEAKKFSKQIIKEV